MAWLSGVVSVDFERGKATGWLDIPAELGELAGSRPETDFPALFPACLICEAAAQLAGFYVRSAGLFSNQLIGLSGFDRVEFTGNVLPARRLVMSTQLLSARPKLAEFHSESFVDQVRVFSACVRLSPIPQISPPSPVV